MASLNSLHSKVAAMESKLKYLENRDETPSRHSAVGVGVGVGASPASSPITSSEPNILTLNLLRVVVCGYAL